MRAQLPIGTHTSAPRRLNSSLYAFGDAVSVCTRTWNGVDAKIVQHGGSQSELVSVMKRYNACTCTPHMHTHRTSVPRSRRLRGRRRGWWRRKRPGQRAHDLAISGHRAVAVVGEGGDH